MLRAADLGSVDVGSPVYFRRVRVGKTVSTELDKDGKGVVIQVFVNAPYDRYVTGGNALLGRERRGGRAGLERLPARDRVPDRHRHRRHRVRDAAGDARRRRRRPPDTAFTLFPNRDAAMKEIYTVKDTYILYFNHSVRGLSVGAPVDFLGVEIGEVTSIKLDFNREQGTVRPAVEIAIYPERLSAPAARARARLRAGPARGVAAALRRPRAARATAHRQPAHRAGLHLPQFLPQGAAGQDRHRQDAAGDSHRARRLRGAADGGHERGEEPGEGAVRRGRGGLPQGRHRARGDAAGSERPGRRRSAPTSRRSSGRRWRKRARRSEKAQILLAEDAPLQGDLQTTLREVQARGAGRARPRRLAGTPPRIAAAGQAGGDAMNLAGLNHPAFFEGTLLREGNFPSTREG